MVLFCDVYMHYTLIMTHQTDIVFSIFIGILTLYVHVFILLPVLTTVNRLNIFIT